MLSRISTTLVLAVGLPLMAIGVLVAPGAALGGSAIALLVAVGTAISARENSDPRDATTTQRSRRTGLIAGGGTLAGWLLVTGLVALLGPASGIILLTVLMSALVIGLWWRLPARLAAFRTIGSGQQLLPLPLPLPTPASPAELSTKALCLAWQHSQRTLRGSLTTSARCEVLSTRQQLLDEMERRDSAGFDRWLAAGACAGIDPGAYLTIE